LSFGEMRVAFAIAFALEPQILLLDEPASCLMARAGALMTLSVRRGRRSGRVGHARTIGPSARRTKVWVRNHESA
jgi:ABC-type transporter Mla maintaining outer membrane lipid asymmetry ATPase subunit MlaF